jgi:hypothetical protein
MGFGNLDFLAILFSAYPANSATKGILQFIVLAQVSNSNHDH